MLLVYKIITTSWIVLLCPTETPKPDSDSEYSDIQVIIIEDKLQTLSWFLLRLFSYSQTASRMNRDWVQTWTRWNLWNSRVLRHKQVRGSCSASPALNRSPGRPAGQRLASGSEDDVAGDDGEHAPHGQKPPPVQFDGEVHRNHPHLDQSHQLRARRTSSNPGSSPCDHVVTGAATGTRCHLFLNDQLQSV